MSALKSSAWLGCLAGAAVALGTLTPLRAANPFASVYISEFMVDGQRVLKDETGGHPAWIELHNGGNATVNLTGWFLTDSPTNLTKWRFPAVALLPNHYLVVFASGRARTNHPAYLHTNFRLDRRGGYLALVNRATNVVFAFAPTYPWQSPASSFGRVRGEAALYDHFPRPTPGKPNATSGPGFAPEVVFAPPGGTFTRPLSVALSCAASNAVIHYTLDGTLPSSQSPAYNAPLPLTNTALLRARAYVPRRLPGPPASAAYQLLHTNLLNFTSTLPVLVMHTFGQRQATKPGSDFVQLTLFEPVNGVTSLTNPPTLAARGGFHERGSSSRGMPQPSFALEFVDEFNDDQPRAPLGLPPDADWVLYAPNKFEPVMIHNPFVHQLSRDLGRYSPRTRFLEAYLVQRPGAVTARDYYGIFVLEEKIKAGKHRVDIHRLGPADLAPPEVTGGYMLKIDRLGPDEGGFHAAGASMAYVEPKEAVIALPQRAAQRQYLRQFFNDFDRALHGPNWLDPQQGYRAFVDVPACIDYHVLEVLSGNVDINGFSTFLHKPRNGKLAFGPHWDFDRALGSTDGRDDNPRHWNTGPFFGGPWWPRLFSDVDFWQQWVDRWQELRQQQFATTNLFALVDRLANELRQAQPRQVKRWDLQPRGGSYQSEINIMKDWLAERADFIDRQFVPPPRLSRAGALLTLTAPPNATVYYTVNGSDPRRPQGGIATNAVAYSKPITVQTNLQIMARAYNPKQRQTDGPPVSTPWSGPVSVRFSMQGR